MQRATYLNLLKSLIFDDKMTKLITRNVMGVMKWDPLYLQCYVIYIIINADILICNYENILITRHSYEFMD